MKKKLISKEEAQNLRNMAQRIKVARKLKGFKSNEELNNAIKEKRGDCPNKSLYTKIETPPEYKQDFYNMKIESLIAIADALDVSTDYLLGLTDEPAQLKNKEIGAIGLSGKAIKKLEEVHKNAKDFKTEYYHSTSKYYRNPYEKELDILNWIIEHIDVKENERDNNEHDFLTSLYQIVMLNFEDYRGSIVEAVINDAQINSYSDWDEYGKYLFEYQNPVTYASEEMDSYEHDMIKQNLYIARRKVVEFYSLNKGKRSVLEELKNGVVSISDPLTYDEVKIRFADPQEMLKKHLLAVIDTWNKEYLKTYEENRIQQEKEIQEWLNRTKDISYQPVEDHVDEDIDEVIPDELLFRRRAFSSYDEEKMKLYMLIEYLEKTPFTLIRIADNGEVIFYGDHSEEEIKDFIEQATKDGVGLCLSDDLKIYYKSELARSTRKRNEELFYKHNLPFHLEEMLKHNEERAETRGVYDPDFCYVDYSDEKVAQIYSEAEKAGYKWKLDGYYILISRVGFDNWFM